MKTYIAPALNSIEVSEPICLNALSGPASGDPAGIRGRNFEDLELDEFLIDEDKNVQLHNL